MGAECQPIQPSGLHTPESLGLLPNCRQVVQSVTTTAMTETPSYFHLHLISDATGETLIAVGRAAAAQYAKVMPVEHVYPLVRTVKQLGLPCLSVLGPVLHLFQAYLGAESTHKVGAQHTLNAEYFRRIDALNYTMLHDDGQQAEDLEEADVVLLGVSRTSKTPTSIYLANRGVKTANVPLVPGVPLPPHVERLKNPLVVGLFATAERIVQIRQNRLLGLKVEREDDQYIDREAVAEEISASRRLCAKHNWPLIDVTRRSIEETAAAVMALLGERRRHKAS